MLLKKSAIRCFFCMLLLVIVPAVKADSPADEPQYHVFIQKVSEDIASLKSAYPQLRAFSADRHADIENLRVTYRYHAEEPGSAVGWRSGVPAPAPAGIWFYIDLHDRDSPAQIHTQPVTGGSLTYGGKDVAFLILEGAETVSVAGPILAILKRNGAAGTTGHDNHTR